MRKIFFSLFLILFPTLLFSQYRRDFEQEIDLGISGGVDFSKVSFLHNMQNIFNKYSFVFLRFLLKKIVFYL